MADNPIINPTQEKVAKTVTSIVLVGTCLFGALGIYMAIQAMYTGTDGKGTDGAQEGKEILQILFSAILPLFGTWIGTILAFYFSRENLLAANKTVQHLVDSITSDKKLAAIKARDIMIPTSKLIYKEYKTGTDDSTLNLKTDFLDFISTNKISRILLLDENKVAKYVLHKSIIQEFIAEQYFSSDDARTGNQQPADEQAGAENADPQNAEADAPDANAAAVKGPRTLTFADMKAKGNAHIQAILRDGVKFVREDANLSDAKVLMKNYSACNDVFITQTGAANEPILGWITEKTIAESSIVD